MEYYCNITINKPINEVLQLFDDPEHLTAWMPGLQSFEHLEGIPGQIGGKSRLVFDNKGKTIELIETVLERDLPTTFKVSYDSPMGYNEVTASFERVSAGQTRYTTFNMFQLAGVMQYLSFLMKSLFKKQSMVYLNAFKEYAEKN